MLRNKAVLWTSIMMCCQTGNGYYSQRFDPDVFFQNGDTIMVQEKQEIGKYALFLYKGNKIYLPQKNVVNYISNFRHVDKETKKYFRHVCKDINKIEIDLSDVISKKAAKDIYNLLLMECLLKGNSRVICGDEQQDTIKVIKTIRTLPNHESKIVGKIIYAKFVTTQDVFIIECEIEHIDVFGRM